MENNQALLSDGGIVFLCIYVLSLILIGWFGKKARKRNTLSDFYLAGRGMGVLILFLTLYATQYSGNTLVGFAGRAYICTKTLSTFKDPQLYHTHRLFEAQI